MEIGRARQLISDSVKLAPFFTATRKITTMNSVAVTLSNSILYMTQNIVPVNAQFFFFFFAKQVVCGKRKKSKISLSIYGMEWEKKTKLSFTAVTLIWNRTFELYKFNCKKAVVKSEQIRPLKNRMSLCWNLMNARRSPERRDENKFVRNSETTVCESFAVEHYTGHVVAKLQKGRKKCAHRSNWKSGRGKARVFTRVFTLRTTFGSAWKGLMFL